MFEKQRRRFFCGDIIHSLLQLRYPELSAAFCSDPILARSNREKVLLEISETGSYLIPAYLADPGWTKIKKLTFGYKQMK